ncbi:MAG: phosphoadenylyl-sulfate reductase [SAR324 cluster bacterium]|nr:phosphoadenylyl-sulfate reductase [SAR324 cluster bacterium]
MTAYSTISESDLPPINHVLERLSTVEVIQWALSVFPRIAFLTSGQRTGSILAKIIYQMGVKVDLIFADTGVLFPETHDTIEKISSSYQLPLKRYTPALSMTEQTEKYGVLYLNHAGQEQCCHMRKVEPLLELHEDYEALLSPLRRGEGGQRSRVPIMDLDINFNVVRISPLANLSDEEYQQYLHEDDTIINPLHAQGFPTIGCIRCTTPVRDDEPRRAGRWRHLSGVDYCGINPSDFSHKTASIELPQEVVQSLKTSFSDAENRK